MAKIPNIPHESNLPSPRDQEKPETAIKNLVTALNLIFYDWIIKFNRLINGDLRLIQLEPQTKAPLTAETKQGTIAYADGATWDPLSSGEGVYRYDGVAWQTVNSKFPRVYLNVLTAEPAAPLKLRGLMVYADGTSWNPGAGEGVYRYDGAAWVFLG